MSEYQYYEFQAIDRPLTEKEIETLESYSSRAEITSTSFINEYQWGDFKGDADQWMERYFDAFLYLANWGTREFKVRLSAKLLPVATAKQFCLSEYASATEKNGKTIVSFLSEWDGGDCEDGDGWLSSLIPIRDELARGDLRALYLGWLLHAQQSARDDTLEPPVPPNLGKLSASLKSLADFLRIDQDLLHVAAECSEKTPTPRRRTIAELIAAAQQRTENRTSSRTL